MQSMFENAVISVFGGCRGGGVYVCGCVWEGGVVGCEGVCVGGGGCVCGECFH